jgi:hypothetical protein
MKPTIRNKLIWGFCGVLVLLGMVAAIGIYAVFSLRHSAQDATRIGGRLNSIALEIQVHNLEAQRRVMSYLQQAKALGPQRAREQFLDEADFEISAIESTAAKAASIAPNAEMRAKFQKIVDETAVYKRFAPGRSTKLRRKGSIRTPRTVKWPGVRPVKIQKMTSTAPASVP